MNIICGFVNELFITIIATVRLVITVWVLFKVSKFMLILSGRGYLFRRKRNRKYSVGRLALCSAKWMYGKMIDLYAAYRDKRTEKEEVYDTENVVGLEKYRRTKEG